MQKFNIDSARLKKETVYQGVTFTLTKVIYDSNGHPVIAEGISRRSFQDAPNPELGKEISEGRALKALVKKLNREKIRHNLMG